MRVAGLVVGLQTAVVHDLVDIIVKFVFRHQVVLAHSFADNFTDRQARGQAGERILEDDLHLGTQRTHFGRGHVVDFLAVEEHLATGLFTAQTQNSTASRGFSASGLTDQAHRAAAAQVEGNAVHSLNIAHSLGQQAALDGEILFEVVDHQNILRVVGDGGVVVFNQKFFLLCHASLTRLSVFFIVAVAADLVRGGQAY